MHVDSPEVPLMERRLLRWLFFIYCLFILYGTFIPFRFSSDPLFVRLQWQNFFTWPIVNGVRQFSILDVASNVLLFVPFGFLWSGCEFGNSRAFGFFRTVIFVTSLGALFSLAIEFCQLFSPGRTTSILDVTSNTVGTVCGGVFGYVIFGGLRGALGVALLQIIHRRPTLILLSLLLIVPLADAYYPFQITLDVSTVWDNLKRTRWMPFVGGFHRFWLDLLLEKVLLFAAIAYLAWTNLKQRHRPSGAGTALFLCLSFAFSVEAGKLLFVGRIPNSENFVLAAAGTFLGVTLVPPLVRSSFCQRYSIGLLLVLVIAILVYSELTPFDWIQSAAELPGRVAKIEWLPFGAYYGADPQSALFDFGKKLLLAGPLGFLIALRRRNCPPAGAQFAAVAAGFILGGILEVAQIFLRSRGPAVTDVLLLTAASFCGALIFERFATLTKS